jgi:drug/metabolite transporter (DMT)-like permease
VPKAGIVGGLLGLAGIYLLVLPSGVAAVNRGDAFTLIGAVCFALHIVLVGTYTRRHSFLHLVPAQILVTGLLAVAMLPVDSHPRLHMTPQLLGAFAFTALLPTSFAFSVQNWAQQYTPSAHTALIFSLEPVFASLSSRLILGERLGGKVLSGAAFILAGMVVSEIWGSRPSPVEG